MFEKPFYKKPHTCPKPEDIVLGQTYTFTINPSDVRQYFESEHYGERIESFNKYWKKTLTDIFGFKCCFYKLQMEISSTGRLHYHGYIIFNKIVQTINQLHKLSMFATYEIDKISDPDIWYKYITKQEKLFESVNIIKNIYTNDQYGDIKI